MDIDVHSDADAENTVAEKEDSEKTAAEKPAAVPSGKQRTADKQAQVLRAQAMETVYLASIKS